MRGAYRDMKKVLTFHSLRHQLILNAIVSAQHGFSDMVQIANDSFYYCNRGSGTIKEWIYLPSSKLCYTHLFCQ